MQFVRTTVAALFATALMMTLTGDAAQAQTTSVRKPYRIKVGAFLPYDTDTKDALGTNFLSLGVGYDLKTTQTFLPTVIEAYFDYWKRPKTTIDFGRVDTLVFGGGIAARFLISEREPGYTPYFGTGVGIYSANASQNTGTVSDSAQRITVGGKFLIGAELKQIPLFGEFEYNFLPHPSILGSDVALSGYQFRLGYRF
jgi:hypothetical protein